MNQAHLEGQTLRQQDPSFQSPNERYLVVVVRSGSVDYCYFADIPALPVYMTSLHLKLPVLWPSISCSDLHLFLQNKKGKIKGKICSLSEYHKAHVEGIYIYFQPS